MRGLRVRLGNEKGAAIALVALSMVALISAVALAVDVGMLVTARTEAQRVADLSALAGAGVLAVLPDAETTARNEAIKFAALNTVQGDVAVVLPGDVAINLDSSTVTVQVMRIQARGTPVGTFFARVFGVNSVDITAVATAIAEPVGLDAGTNCLLPIMLPDRWTEDLSNIDDEFAPGPWPTVDDSYDPPGSSIPGSKDSIPDGYDQDKTSYKDAVIGDQLEIHKSGGGGGGINPSNYYPWTPFDDRDQLDDGGPGAATYENRFTNCLEGEYLKNDSVWTEPGAMVGPTKDGFAAAIAQDPLMTWQGPPDNCPWKEGKCWTTGYRIKSMPMFDPTEAPDNGRKIVHIRNFASVFIEDVLPGSVYTVRWLGLLDGSSSSAPPEPESLIKRLRLIR